MKKCWFFFFIFLSFLSAVKAQSPPRTPDNLDISIMEREAHQKFRDVTGIGSIDSFTVASHNFDVHHYRCEWQVTPGVRFIQGKVTASFSIKSASDKLIFDLNNLFTVDSIIYHGVSISFQKVLKDGLQVQLPASLNAGVKDSVSIYYQGVPDPLNSGAFFSGNWRGTNSIWTLSEPYGAKNWWPCKNGLTDKADSVDIIVTCPTGNTAASNGLLVHEQVSGPNSVFHFQHRYPIASYLVAIAVSTYNITRDSVLLGGHQMPLVSYSYSWSMPGRFIQGMAAAKQALPIFSRLFGIYPFYKEHYAHTHWGAGGGMEHQTNSFLIDNWPDLAAHELGHQWFGDKVTCGSWADLWLNEGFATYSTTIFYEHTDTATHRLILQNQTKSITSQPGGSVWVEDTTNVPRLFSNRLTYNKGGYVVHMLRWILGDSTFFRGVRRYLNDAAVAYSFATTKDLKKALEEESGKNLTSFFDKWVYGEGYPNYHADWTQNNNNWIKLTLNQTTSHSSVRFYEMPVTIVAKSGTREKEFILDHRYSGQEFLLDAGFAVDTILIDPKLWILSKTKSSAKISSSTQPNEFKLFPNPAPTHLTLTLKNPTDKKLNIQLINSLGQIVYQRELQLAGNDETINVPVSMLPMGVYWFKMQSEKELKYVRKVVH